MCELLFSFTIGLKAVLEDVYGRVPGYIISIEFFNH